MITPKIPTICPYCNHEWYDEKVQDRVTNATINLLHAAQYLATSEEEPPFVARFEVDGDEPVGSP